MARLLRALGVAPPRRALSYNYPEFRDDGSRCKRCGTRSQLFGNRDPESGWEGYCRVCNMEWYTWQLDSSVRTCNRACSIHCLCGLIPLTYACSLIRDFIFQGYAAKVRWSILSRWRFRHLRVCWLAGPLESVSESESNSEDEEGMVVRGTLLDLRKPVESPGFILQCKPAFRYFTLLDAVMTYLYHPLPLPPRCLPEDCQTILGSVESGMKQASSLLAGLDTNIAAAVV